MEQTPTPEQTPPNKATWLTDLESKSWSLEMTISGAATVAVSFLPGLIERGLNYYLENLAPSESKFATLFPILSYSFFMVLAWVLIVFFCGAFVHPRALGRFGWLTFCVSTWHTIWAFAQCNRRVQATGPRKVRHIGGFYSSAR